MLHPFKWCFYLLMFIHYEIAGGIGAFFAGAEWSLVRNEDVALPLLDFLEQDETKL